MRNPTERFILLHSGDAEDSLPDLLATHSNANGSRGDKESSTLFDSGDLHEDNKEDDEDDFLKGILEDDDGKEEDEDTKQ